MLTDFEVSDNCRLCSKDLNTIASLGSLSLTSIFPKEGEYVPSIPLTVMKCPNCGLVQLREITNPDLMYREGYGYKSGINESMVKHLKSVVDYASTKIPLTYWIDESDEYECDTRVLDIGCNDGTLLKAWGEYPVKRYGIDPIGEDVEGCFVTKDYFRKDEKKYKVITSLSMFYDLQDPIGFAKDVEHSLEKDGIWIVEVGYAGTLLEGKWDGICHEHLSYYGVRQLQTIGKEAGLNITDLWFNDVNGGSVCVVYGTGAESEAVAPIVEKEKVWNWDDLEVDIKLAAKNIRNACWNKKVYALGASTKGNMLLQTCWLSKHLIAAAIDRNPDKVGRTINGIPIRSEDWCRENPPDAFLVLPYHFKEGLLKREDFLRKQGVQFIFPLPKVDIL